MLPLDELERRAILSTLRQTGGDKQATARALGIGKTTLYRKLKQYQIERTDA
jgi:two-component system response regulator HydG